MKIITIVQKIVYYILCIFISPLYYLIGYTRLFFFGKYDFDSGYPHISNIFSILENDEEHKRVLSAFTYSQALRFCVHHVKSDFVFKHMTEEAQKLTLRYAENRLSNILRGICKDETKATQTR